MFPKFLASLDSLICREIYHPTMQQVRPRHDRLWWQLDPAHSKTSPYLLRELLNGMNSHVNSREVGRK